MSTNLLVGSADFRSKMKLRQMSRHLISQQLVQYHARRSIIRGGGYFGAACYARARMIPMQKLICPPYHVNYSPDVSVIFKRLTLRSCIELQLQPVFIVDWFLTVTDFAVNNDEFHSDIMGLTNIFPCTNYYQSISNSNSTCQYPLQCFHCLCYLELRKDP